MGIIISKKALGEDSTLTEKLPNEVAEDVLSRLPVKSLKRFLCVSKFWKRTINGESFIKLHLQKTSETKAHRRLVCFRKEFRAVNLDEDRVNCFTSRLEPPVGNLDEDCVNWFTPLLEPTVGDLSFSQISNSCNGLFVVSTKFSEEEQLIVWNPFTKKSQALPLLHDVRNSLMVDDYPSLYAFGIVFDPRNEDYKIVRVRSFCGQTQTRFPDLIRSSAHIFSMKSKKWNSIEGFKYVVPYSWKCEVKGQLLTIIKEDWDKYSLRSFDVQNEKHMELELPVDVTGRQNVNLQVNEIGGSISVSCITGDVVDVWVMGQQGLWMKILSTPVTWKPISVQPLVYSKYGEKLLLYWDHSSTVRAFVWLDPRNGHMERISVQGDYGHVVACVESLVSIPSTGVKVRRDRYTSTWDPDWMRENQRQKLMLRHLKWAM